MKITIVTGPWLPVPAVQGGSVPRMWHGLAKQFVVRGHQTVILARSYPGQAPSETVDGVEFRRWGGFSQSRSIRRDLVKDAIYAASLLPRLPCADILVINDFWLPAFAGLAARAAGAIVISANRFPKGQFWMYRKAALIAAASTAVKDAITLQSPRLKEKIAVVPNPLDTETFCRRPKLRKTGGTRTILFVGRIHPEKGIHVLVKAFALVSHKYSGLRLQVVGPVAEEQGGGGDGYLAQLRRAAENLPVSFDDPVFDPAALAEIYRGVDLFCYPSLADKGESFGVAPLEAMATGLAPIVSDLSCFKDFVTDQETGWFFDHRGTDPAGALASKLDELLSDPARREAAGQRAAEIALRFGFGQVGDTFLNYFSTVLASRHETTVL
jgi:glycosyltransferase involved in cell wall biosynthesis